MTDMLWERTRRAARRNFALNAGNPQSRTLLAGAWGMSRAERSAKARAQLRDRYGRWVDMGARVSFRLGKERGGGRFAGVDDEGMVRVLQDGDVVRRIPVENVKHIEGVKAVLPAHDLDENGRPRPKWGGNDVIYDLERPDEEQQKAVADLLDDFAPDMAPHLNPDDPTDAAVYAEDADPARGEAKTFEDLPYDLPPVSDFYPQLEFIEQEINDQYEQYKSEFEEYGRDSAELMSPEDFRQGVIDGISGRLRGEGPITVRVPLDVLGGLFKRGGLVSQFESDTSRGAYDPTARTMLERMIFGIKNIPNRLRPIYGSNTDVEARSYGEVAVELDESEVGDRTTVAYGDTLDHGIPRPIELRRLVNGEATDEEILLAGGSYGAAIEGANITDEYGMGEFGDLQSYVEIQVHGGVALEDIKAAWIDGDGPAQYEQLYQYPPTMGHPEEGDNLRGDAEAWVLGVLQGLGLRPDRDWDQLPPEIRTLAEKFVSDATNWYVNEANNEPDTGEGFYGLPPLTMFPGVEELFKDLVGTIGGSFEVNGL